MRIKALNIVLALLWLASALAQGAEAAPDADSATRERLMAPGLLPDIMEGSPDAPVTVVEYASVTCSHCAAFHAETWPGLKAKYVDTGKVKFVLREFPLDPVAAAGFMLARCVGSDKRNALIDRLFDQQKAWAFVEKPAGPLLALVKQAGMSQTDFDACLKDQRLFESINKSRDQAAAQFGIGATPTFFVNGRKLTGEQPISEFDKILAPLLK